MPIVEEDIDGLSGLLFPFYDADTHMLYLAGKVSADHSRKICLFISILRKRIRVARREKNNTGEKMEKKILLRFSFGLLI